MAHEEGERRDGGKSIGSPASMFETIREAMAPYIEHARQASIREGQERRELLQTRWSARRAALGKALARYLYVLALAGLFYFVLDSQLFGTTSTRPDNLHLSFLDIDVNALLIWSTGPSVLAFLTLAALGTELAIDTAEAQLGALTPYSDLEQLTEEFDSAPTAVDMAFYWTGKSPRLVRILALLSLPAILTAFTIGALCLALAVTTSDIAFRAKTLVTVLDLVLPLATIPRLVLLWGSRIEAGVKTWGSPPYGDC